MFGIGHTLAVLGTGLTNLPVIFPVSVVISGEHRYITSWRKGKRKEVHKGINMYGENKKTGRKNRKKERNKAKNKE
jgi:hypothetical protein